ncbi:FtsK/SpoIIIE domain-containing protein [Aquipuribacter hungaricus]|uniref:FtsK/SpoIIIE domain-containing protein n=1 Tax=Aquipuribacter hungaricus TaxID=545624 RepID=A0ABV7WJW0_9MICO
MRLRWTVVGAGAEAPAVLDVLVTCPRGTRLPAVLDLLPPPLSLGGPGAAPDVSVSGVVVDGTSEVGHAPLLDGAVLRLGSPPPGRPVAQHLLELAVVAGPDAGTVVPLARGRLRLGRSATCEVRLTDPRLSREHCVLTVTPAGVQVQDNGSTNGTGGAGVSSHVALEQEWRAGAGRFVLRPSTRPCGARPLPDGPGDGTVPVRPPPRTRSVERAPELRLPAAARQGRTSTFPLLAVVLPALAATGLAWWTGSAVYLVLAALGPLLVAGSWWTSRRDARREGRLGRKEHARAVAEVHAAARAAADALARAQRQAVPDATVLLEQCVDVGGRLWERHHRDADALRVRLGHCVPGDDPGHASLAHRVRVTDPAGGSVTVRTEDDLVVLDLREGPVGVVEPDDDPSCARSVVGQLVALLPPTSLTVVPVVSGAARDRWRWLGLLPHDQDEDTTSAGAGLPDPAAALDRALRTVTARAAVTRPSSAGDATDGTGQPAAVLVLVDDPDGTVDDARLQRLSAAGTVGVHVLVVARSTDSLPRTCALVVHPASPDGVEGVLLRPADGARETAVLDRAGPVWALRLARALAPLRPAGPGPDGALPGTVSLADLVDLAPAATARRWAEPPDGLPVPLGVGPAGPVVVDLTTAGPHALVAGTTGAGKSELLRSWVLAMAATQPPDRLAVLLVDYKGGATFDDLSGLPHCVGLLTDLDGGTTSRVLHSLRAEVRRRERLLSGAGARDVTGYRRAVGVAGPALPRLLVVVDEFRVLADDAPDVLDQFVRLAATGRSLGIHLVLATQRPGGVVSTDIRANAGLRIALRVQDVAESRDVVDRPDAAWLPPTAPGRAVVVGAGIEATVQTAWTGAGAQPPRTSVLPVDGWSTAAPVLTRPPARPPVTAPSPDGPGGAKAVVDAVAEAARLTGARPAVGPWLPPLPARLEAEDPVVVDAPLREDRDGPGTAVGAQDDGGDGLVLAVADLPWSQARALVRWRPVLDGPLLVLGSSRSGRSTTLLTTARAAAGAGIPVMCLRGGDGLDDHTVDVLVALASSPPGGAAIGGGEGHGADDQVAACRVLLLVDDVDELLDPGADPEAADLLLRLVRSGHRDGVGLVLAGGRALAASRLAAGARARLVHRTVDRGDAMLAGVPSEAPVLPHHTGRCHVVGLDTLASDAGLDAGTPVPAVEAQVLDPGSPSQPSGPAPGWLPRALPASLALSTLPTARGLVVALGATPSGGPWWLDLGRGGLVVVAGPARSGRTTALGSVAVQAAAARLRVAHPGDASSAAAMGVGTLQEPTPPDRAATADRPAAPADLLLLDDVDRSPADDLAALEQWLTTGGGPLQPLLTVGATVVVAGSTAWLADGFRGLPALARQVGRGLVLSPGRTDLRDVLGVRGGPVQREHRPGRGLAVDRGEVTRVQIAYPQ